MLSELPHEFSRLRSVLDYFDNRKTKYCKVNGLQEFQMIFPVFFKNLGTSVDLPSLSR